MVLYTSLLNTQHYKVRIEDKVNNPGKGVAPSPTPRCSSYWKELRLPTLESVLGGGVKKQNPPKTNLSQIP